MAKKKVRFVGVIGAGKCSNEMKQMAEEVGHGIASEGAVLVCGGLGGVMEAAARGAKKKGGMTIGILPGSDKSDANDYIDIPIPTGIGQARNMVVVNSSDVVIALPGKFGTLSEMAFAMKLGKPLVSLSAWNIDDNIPGAETPKEAVEMAFKLIKG